MEVPGLHQVIVRLFHPEPRARVPPQEVEYNWKSPAIRVYGGSGHKLAAFGA